MSDHAQDVDRRQFLTYSAAVVGLGATGKWAELRDLVKANRAVERLQAGNVWVNAYNLLHPAVPFGGYKNSGFGREGGFSGMSHFTREKSVWFTTG